MADLDKMSSAELRQLSKDVEKRIKIREQEELDAARKEVEAIANRIGVPLSQLIPNTGNAVQRRSGKPVEVKFRRPDDPSQTWTGRGRQPQWVRQWQSEHGNLDGLRA